MRPVQPYTAYQSDQRLIEALIMAGFSAKALEKSMKCTMCAHSRQILSDPENGLGFVCRHLGCAVKGITVWK